MKRKIYNIIIVFILTTGTTYSQYVIEANAVIYEITEDSNDYIISCVYNKSFSNSRSRGILQSRLRLKSIDIAVCYRIYETYNISYEYKKELFETYYKYIYKGNTLVLNNIRCSEWEKYNGRNTINIFIPKDNFDDNYINTKQDISTYKLLEINFINNTSIYNANRLIEYGLENDLEIVNIEKILLSKKDALPPEFSPIFKYYNNNLFESTLYEDDSLLNVYVQSASSVVDNKKNIISTISNKVLFNVSNIKQKQYFYIRYINSLNKNKFYKALNFVSSVNTSGRIIDTTINEMIEHYSTCINTNIIRFNNDLSNYNIAVQHFSKKEYDKALTILIDDINLNGINSKTTNLIGACYRLKNEPIKALSYLLFTFYINKNTDYLYGNTVLCLSMLKYKDIKEFSLLLSSQKNIDPWSKEQINNLKY